MAISNKKDDLKKYQNHRRERISVFGLSADFDWFMLNLTAFILIVIVFVFSIREIRYTMTYQPGPDSTTQTLLNDKKTLETIDGINSKFSKEQEDTDVDIQESEETLEEEIVNTEE